MTFKVIKEFSGFNLYNNKDITVYAKGSTIDLTNEHLRSVFWKNRISDNDIEEIKTEKKESKVKKQDNI